MRRFAATLILVTAAASGVVVGAPAAQAAAHDVVSLTASPTPLTVGQTVNLTATISPPQQILESAITVSFAIVSGPNTGQAIASCAIDMGALGGATTCSTSYVGGGAGTDTIQASAGGGASTTTVTWQGVPALIFMSPAVSFNATGHTAAVTATVVDRRGVAVAGASVSFAVTGPGTPGSGSATSDGNGNAAFSFSSSTPGKSTIKASTAGTGSSVVTGSATAFWAGPPATVVLNPGPQNPGGIAPVNASATVVAGVTDAGGNPVGDGTSVSFTVTGDGATHGSSSTSGGNALFSFSAGAVGTSTVVAQAPPAPVSNAVTISWQIPTATSISITPTQTHAIVDNPQTLVATVLDQFGRPFSGAHADPSGADVKVRFSLQGVNGVPTTLSTTPDAKGQAALSYIGHNLGIDTITAFVDIPNTGIFEVSDPRAGANVFWLPHPGQGYWLGAADGGIFNYGPSTSFQKSMGGQPLNKPIVGLARTPSGFGYWLVASDGGIFSFGDGKFQGSTGSIHLNKPIVGMAPTATGGGYWLVASDGGIFAFGDAKFYGSMGAQHLNKPIVGIGGISDGSGYFMAATDGGVFNFGPGSSFFGSAGGMPLNSPIVGIAVAP